MPDAIELTLSVESFQVPATPGTAGLAAELPCADLARDAAHFRGNVFNWSTIVLMVSLSSRISSLTSTVILLEIAAARNRGRDVGDVAHLPRQVAGHRVDGIREVLPRAGDAWHRRLSTQLALGADLARDSRHLTRSRSTGRPSC